jgi:hypothetical protein
MIEVVANVANIDKARLEQLVVDNEVPCGGCAEQAFAFVGVGNAVGKRLVVVTFQEGRVEVLGLIRHRAGRDGLGRVGIVGTAARSLEDLVLSGHLLKVSLEALVLDGGLLLSIFEIGELGLEVLDVLLLALAERSLSSTVLSLAARLGRCGILVVITSSVADVAFDHDIVRTIACSTAQGRMPLLLGLLGLLLLLPTLKLLLLLLLLASTEESVCRRGRRAGECALLRGRSIKTLVVEVWEATVGIEVLKAFLDGHE